MRVFKDENGNAWVATAAEEATPRHHGRWYLVFHPEHDATNVYDVPEIRWQTAATAKRTLDTMAEFELRRRINTAQLRHRAEPVRLEVAENKAPRERTNINAG